jgi:hypothetical protein
MKTLDKKSEQRIARPLKTLVPLIKADLSQMHEVQEAVEVSMSQRLQPYRIAIGEKLLEAKPQVKHGNFKKWIADNFPLMSYRTAAEYMEMVAHQKRTGTHFSGPQHFRRMTKASYKHNHTGTARWRNDVQQRLDAFPAGNFNVEVEVDNRAKEQKLVSDLALEIISIGYKVLATKMHPDRGGSDKAMQRLNDARDMLKGAVQ